VGMGDMLSREESDQMIRQVDEDGTGEIEFGEFLKVMRRKPQHVDSKEDIIKAFEDLAVGACVDGLTAGEANMDLLRGWLEMYKPGNEDLWDQVDESNNLTQSQIAEFKEAFSLFDRDGDGSISVAELGVVLQRLGQNPREEDLRALIDDVDDDGSGRIEIGEFLVLMANKMREKDKPEELDIAFNIFDKDGDGTVDAKELKDVLKSLCGNIEDEEVDNLIKAADEDEDGLLNKQEFINFMSGMSADQKPPPFEPVQLRSTASSGRAMAAAIKDETNGLSTDEVMRLLERTSTGSGPGKTEGVVNYVDFIYTHS